MVNTIKGLPFYIEIREDYSSYTLYVGSPSCIIQDSIVFKIRHSSPSVQLIYNKDFVTRQKLVTVYPIHKNHKKFVLKYYHEI